MLQRFLVIAVMMVATSSTAWAGAWTVPRGRAYLEYFYRAFISKKEFDAEGNSGRRAKTALFTDIRNEFKAEYGLTDWLNVLASVPYQSAHYRDDTVDLLNSNVGDIFVRTKLRFVDKPLVGSVQFSVKIPSAYDVKESPGLGDGQVDVESRLLLSRAFTFDLDRAPWHGIGSGTSRTSGASASPVSHQTGRSREASIRRAILTATLFEHGRQLWEQDRGTEALAWLSAVLEEEPWHAETLRLFAQALPDMEESWFWPQPRLVSASRYEPILPESPEPLPELKNPGVAFINLESGFNARDGDPANEIPLVAEVGITPLKRLMVVGSIENVWSIKSTREQEEDFSKWGVRAIVNMLGDGFASVFRDQRNATVNVEVGYNDIFNGRNTADAYEIFTKLGVFF